MKRAGAAAAKASTSERGCRCLRLTSVSLNGQPEIAPIRLQLSGPLRAATDAHDNILPSLRKAAAIFAVLALTDGCEMSRRQLAALLWSRNETAQALARLRDTLHTLRQSLRETLGETDVLRLSGDRVSLAP